MTQQLNIGTHPDIMSLHARYESASETAAGQIVGGTTFLAGLYLAISPFVVGFDGQAPILWNNVIIGVATALLGLGLGAAFDRTHRLAWTMPILGLWMIVSPWVIRAGDLSRTDNQWNNVVTGAVMLLVGLAAFVMARGRSLKTLGRQETARS